MEEREKQSNDESKDLRRCLKDRVAHPYITSQGLAAPEKTNKETDAPETSIAEDGES